jgi:hypothetical protein
MSMTPGTVWRSRAMMDEPCGPGSWPALAGLRALRHLISISLALARYAAVTPKRPLAICLIARVGRSPLGAA